MGRSPRQTARTAGRLAGAEAQWQKAGKYRTENTRFEQVYKPYKKRDAPRRRIDRKKNAAGQTVTNYTEW